MKKKFIVIGGLIVIAVIIWFARAEKFGGPVMPESYIYSNQDASFTSISYDGGTDEIITDAAHNLAVTDAIVFYTASAAFGDGEAAPGFTEGTRYFVVTASTSTAFEISATQGGSALDLTVASAGGGEFVYELIEGRVFDASQGRTFVYSFCGDATASAAVQFVGSIQNTQPDFYAAKLNTNRYDAIDVYGLQNGTSIDGDTGITINASADCTQYQAFGTNLKWISAIVTSFGEGYIDLQLQISN